MATFDTFTLNDLLKFVEIENSRLTKNIDYGDKEKQILAYTIKLSEEVGELSDNVLSFLNLQRKEKLEKFSIENLEGELADVIFVTMLLAKSLNIDIVKASKEKSEKLNRYYDNIKKSSNNLQ